MSGKREAVWWGWWGPSHPPPAASPAASPAAANHLVFVHSGRGNHYYLGDRHRIGMYQQEADPHTSQQDITGLGRFLLIRVEQPTEEIYLRVALSKSFMGSKHTSWTPERSRVLAATEGPRILAQKDAPLGFVGHGAVNRIIGPLRPDGGVQGESMAGSGALLVRTDHAHLVAAGQGCVGQGADAFGEHTIVVADQDPERCHRAQRHLAAR